MARMVSTSIPFINKSFKAENAVYKIILMEEFCKVRPYLTLGLLTQQKSLWTAGHFFRWIYADKPGVGDGNGFGELGSPQK
ncbi:hypothetical protein ACTXT7_016193 [Hymenolepis weldensis]